MEQYNLTIPKDIFLNHSLSPTDKLIYGLLNSINKPSVNTIAKLVNRSERTIWRAKAKFNTTDTVVTDTDDSPSTDTVVTDTDDSPSTDTVVTDTDDSKPSREEKRKAWVHYQNLINGLKTYEEYENNIIELSKLKKETLLTQNQIETLRKMLSQKLQKLKN
jgi:hypothetical protein